jgi:hypothetical protein
MDKKTTKRTTSETQNPRRVTPNTPGAGKHRISQTPGEWEQDPERRLGDFTGAGEAPIKQPGTRKR